MPVCLRSDNCTTFSGNSGGICSFGVLFVQLLYKNAELSIFELSSGWALASGLPCFFVTQAEASRT